MTLCTDEWRPIAEAPRDEGRPLWVCLDTERKVFKWIYRVEHTWYYDGVAIAINSGVLWLTNPHPVVTTAGRVKSGKRIEPRRYGVAYYHEGDSVLYLWDSGGVLTHTIIHAMTFESRDSAQAVVDRIHSEPCWGRAAVIPYPGGSK